MKIECGLCADINQVVVEYSYQYHCLSCVNCSTPLGIGKNCSSLTLDSSDTDLPWLVSESDSCYLPSLPGFGLYSCHEKKENEDTNTTNLKCKFCGGDTEILFMSDRYCPKCKK